MKLSHTLLATVAMIALAGPAFAQSANPTLLTTPTTTQAAVTTTIAPACAITGVLSDFALTISPNGLVSNNGGTKSVKVTCNTPDGNITLGSDDMVNDLAPAITGTDGAVFTNKIKFNGRANGADSVNWDLYSRPFGIWGSSATIGWDRNTRIRNLDISVGDIKADSGKLPVAGSYKGTICVTVTPVGPLFGTAFTATNSFCGGGLGGGPLTGGSEPESIG